MSRPIFHLAFPVRDLEEAKNFYISTFNAKMGRTRDNWIDIFLFGAQVTMHERPAELLSSEQHGVRHFGAVLSWKEWESLAKRLNEMNATFKVKPNTSFIGTQMEQAKMLLTDPSGNVIEIKAYRNPSAALELEDHTLQ